ncbi:hypothetical protein MTsPCn5_11260 [Croceitalea sp. MTPC5]|uniref:hypothetical protein n=1 Tax=Croceitalea sp. MTPC5 TaxID=3056565 RepID=UPI002B3D34FA|nr:hypothetical protein MTsPCn5_11260 [Croceitalea sp. MTPC5]
MKDLYPFFILGLLLISGCKTDRKEEKPKEMMVPTVLEKIASAHGYENWKSVSEIAFTFNVDRDSTHFERSWVWKPKRNEVTYISGNDSLVYNRRNMDSMALKANAGFINDRYWLLAPFNLIWDASNFEYTHIKSDTAPISKKPMQKLTIVYGTEGGYTPGDAYDFYFEDDFLIREWVFRESNQSDPSMTTTWENYRMEDGFKFALDHKKANENFNLFFDNVAVTMKE